MSTEGEPTHGYMYLELTRRMNGTVMARVRKDGRSFAQSVGTEHSRTASAPFMIVAIDGFAGLDVIGDTALLEEVFRRFSTKELAQRLQIRYTKEELLEMIAAHLRN